MATTPTSNILMRRPRPRQPPPPDMIDFDLNWCRLCRVCLTCQGIGRTVRQAFNTKSCECPVRVVVSCKGKKNDKGPKTVDFRFKTLSTRDIEALQCLLRQMRSNVPPIENNLHRANLCGTCQQRIRRAIDGMRNPHGDGDESVDFRRRRSIRVTVSEDIAASAQGGNATTRRAINNVTMPVTNLLTRPTPPRHRPSSEISGDTEDSNPHTYANISAVQSPPQQLLQHQQPQLQHRLEHASFENIPSARAHLKAARSKPINIVFEDARGAELFREWVFGEMTLHELLDAYYPSAPAELLFREQLHGCLYSRHSQVSQIPRMGDLIVIKVHLPRSVPGLQLHRSRMSPPKITLPSISVIHERHTARYQTAISPLEITNGRSIPYLATQTTMNNQQPPYLQGNSERSINHVSPQKVKGEQLLSFRYRQISADDIDIFNDIWPRFRFVTPPLERNLLRANICSTCQQRLRRARLARNSHLQGISKGDSTEDEGIVLSDEEEDPAQVYQSTRPASRVGSFGSSGASGWTPRVHPANAVMSPIQYQNSSLRSTISQDFANQNLPEMIAAPVGSLPRPTVGQSDTCKRLGAAQTPSSLHVGDKFPACKSYECRTEVPDSGGTESHSATAVTALAQMHYTRHAAGLPATPVQAYEVEECNSDDDQDAASADELDITHVETPNQ
ncbi:hypothetical protein EC988_000847, partial [Linderina pennispora]